MSEREAHSGSYAELLAGLLQSLRDGARTANPSDPALFAQLLQGLFSAAGRGDEDGAAVAGSAQESADRLQQVYLAWCSALDTWLQQSGLQGLDAARATFLLRTLREACAPHNTLLGNAAARQRAQETKGESLRRGWQNYIDDLRHNHGYPAVADRTAFTVGVDVASTAGAVVYRSEVLELIRYTPSTRKVHARPLLYVFSQVNRFYLGDLTPDRSLFRALLAAGIPVFAVSWRNPTAAQRNWGLDTYVDGVIRCIDVIKELTRSAQVHLAGVCAGGITATVATGVLRARARNDVASLSLLINVLDNRPEDSEFGIWTTEQLAREQKQQVRARGFFSERQVFEMFAWLRPEENIMSFLRSNYLLGEPPPRHPLLFWSMDYTRMPARLHADYLDLALHNTLAQGKHRSLGMQIDLQRIDCPIYIMAGSTDHITPWTACYRSLALFNGPREFVLTNQNHTQTLCARDDNAHLRYWRNPDLPRDAAEWQTGAQETQGYWRAHWIDWLARQSGAMRASSKKLATTRYPVLAAAPGEYVLGR